MSGMGYGGYEAMERRERMDSRTTSENMTFKLISATAAEAWVREVGLAKMPVPSVSLEDVKRAFTKGYELANAVREKESLLLQAELRKAQVEGPRIGALEEAKLFIRYLAEEANDTGNLFEFREACKYICRQVERGTHRYGY